MGRRKFRPRPATMLRPCSASTSARCAAYSTTAWIANAVGAAGQRSIEAAATRLCCYLVRECAHPDPGFDAGVLRSIDFEPDLVAAQEPRRPRRVVPRPHRLAAPLDAVLFQRVFQLLQVLVIKAL